MDKMGEGDWEIQISSDEMIKSWEYKAEHKECGQWYCNIVVWGQMVVTCGEHSIMYKLIKSLYCIPETYVTLCVKYTQTFKKVI